MFKLVNEFLAFSKCKILILDSIGETTMAMPVDWKKRSRFQFQNPTWSVACGDELLPVMAPPKKQGGVVRVWEGR